MEQYKEIIKSIIAVIENDAKSMQSLADMIGEMCKGLNAIVDEANVEPVSPRKINGYDTQN